MLKSFRRIFGVTKLYRFRLVSSQILLLILLPPLRVKLLVFNLLDLKEIAMHLFFGILEMEPEMLLELILRMYLIPLDHILLH